MGRGDGERDRLEAFGGIIRDLREQRRIYDEGAEDKEYRVAVGSSFRRLASTDVPGRAGYVLDIKLLSEPVAELLSNDAGENVDGTARSECDNHAHGAGWIIVLRRLWPCARGQNGGADGGACKSNELAARKRHQSTFIQGNESRLTPQRPQYLQQVFGIPCGAFAAA